MSHPSCSLKIPVGVGAAFAEMYKNKYQFPVQNIGIAMYGAFTLTSCVFADALVVLSSSSAP